MSGLGTVERECDPFGGQLGRREEGFIARVSISFGGTALLVS